MSIYVVLALFFFGHVYAEEIYELEKIQVSAKKRVSDFNFSQSVNVSTPQLDSQALGQITPLLSEVPGVIASQNGGPGSRASYFIRGTESRHVAFVLDGMKINDASNVDRQFDSAFMSSPFLKDIKVYKGPQAVLFGSDAMGGLVEMTTRKGENAPETRVNINGGSFGTISSSISTDWGAERHRGTITGYRFHSGGISRLNKKRFHATEKDSTDTTQLTSSSSHFWNSKLDSDFLFSFLRGENELDGNSTDNSQDRSLNDQLVAQQKTNFRLNQSSAISLRSGVNQHKRTIHTLSSGTVREYLYQGSLIQNEALYKYEKESFNLLGGLASEHEQVQVSQLDRGFDLFSIFLQSAYRISQLKFFGGVRAEKHTRYGNFMTGSGGVAFVRGHHTFFTQYSQGFKAPSLYQLYGPSYPGYTVGNSQLVPEVNHSFEGGWYFHNELFDSTVTYFQNRLSNLITYVETQGYFNQSRFTAEGLELSGVMKQKYFHLSSSFTHQGFRNQESAVIGRPLNSLMTGIALFPNENSEISLKGRWFTARKGQKDLNSVVKLNGYEAFDLGYRYFFSNIELGFQVLNLMNRDYEELYGYSVMPRSIFVHSGFRF